jgi:hypothetical protein
MTTGKPGPSISLHRVGLHEVGHAIGLDHGPPGVCVMSPYLTDFSVPQAWDLETSRNLYGMPKSVPPIKPVPIPTPKPVDPISGVPLKVPGKVPVRIVTPGDYILRVDSGKAQKQVILTMKPR